MLAEVFKINKKITVDTEGAANGPLVIQLLMANTVVHK